MGSAPNGLGMTAERVRYTFYCRGKLQQKLKLRCAK